MMRRLVAILSAALVLGTSGAAAQPTGDGEVTGRITDSRGVMLPGVLVRISSGTGLRTVVTDEDGRFAVRSLAPASYRVVAELAGFTTTSGDIELSPTNKRAHLIWRLESGCLTDEVRIIFNPRQAAPLVEAMWHIRVTSANGPVLTSERPECAPRTMQDYTVEVLGGPSGGRRGQARLLRRPTRIFLHAWESALESGQEYLTLLWPNDMAAETLVLPVVAGRVAATKAADELGGMPVATAMETLERWSRERLNDPRERNR